MVLILKRVCEKFPILGDKKTRATGKMKKVNKAFFRSQELRNVNA
jgi:hypothetical protein